MEELIKNMNNKEIEYENKNYSEKRENYIKILNEFRNFNNNLDKNNIFKEQINSIINSIETKKDCLFYEEINDKNIENSIANKIYLNFKKKQDEKSVVIKLKSQKDFYKETSKINNESDFEIIEKSNIATILDKIKKFKENQHETFSIKDGQKIFNYWNTIENLEKMLKKENFQKNRDNFKKLNNLKTQVEIIREEYSNLNKKYEEKENYLNIKKK
jgi:hypothetical protein